MSVRMGGVAMAAPAGWETRLRRQPAGSPGLPGNMLLHAATTAIPADRGDFGSGAVEMLGPDDVFVSLLEYDRVEAGSTLFAAQGVPTVRPSEFSPTGMQRPLPGQSGGQWFFTAADRPYCLFVVLGSHARRTALAVRVNALLRTLQLGPS